MRENAIKIAESYLANQPRATETNFWNWFLIGIQKYVFNFYSPWEIILMQRLPEARNQLLFQDIEDPWVHYAALSTTDLDPIVKLFSQAASHLNKSNCEGTGSFCQEVESTDFEEWKYPRAEPIFNWRCKRRPLMPGTKQWFLKELPMALIEKRTSLYPLQNIRSLASNFDEATDPVLRQKSLALLKTALIFLTILTIHADRACH